MRIDISVHISDARQWLLPLRDALRVDGHKIFFRIFGEERGRDPAISTLKLLELAAFGSGKGLWSRGNLDHILPEAEDDKADLVIVLSPGGSTENRAIFLTLDGQPGIGSAMPALLARRVPFVECLGSDGASLAAGLPAVESPDIIVHALDEFYARIITLLRMAVRRAIARRERQAAPASAAKRDGAQHSFGFASLGSRLWRRITRQHRLGDHWRVGIRPKQAVLPARGDVEIAGFNWLPDDGKRYYADPILFTHHGSDFVFVEEYPYETKRGVIAFSELNADGAVQATPRVIIQREGHLSYPFLFAHDGEVWMIPENAAEKRLPLYRARCFPDDWVFERDLLAGVAVHDATLLNHAGAWWLLANTEEDGGSSWDCLTLFRADSPIGTFTRVGEGPAIIDARYARSAGPVIEVEGRLIRPVQSCLGHYGRFLRFLEVEALDDAGITQREVGRLLAPLGAKAAGVHTYSSNARFEAIDAFGI